MTQNDQILNELNELKSTLKGGLPGTIFSVPAGYFDELSLRVLGRIKALEATDANEELMYLSPLLSGLSRQLPFEVPAGYFAGLEDKLLESVRNSADYLSAKEELESISPLLSGMNKKTPFTVPAGYFEQL